MIRRRLSRSKSAYYDAPELTLDSPEVLILAVSVPSGPEAGSPFFFVRDHIANAVDGTRSVIFRPAPNVTLFTGVRAFRPAALEALRVELSWSDYLKLLKRRKSIPPERHHELILINPPATQDNGLLKCTATYYQPK